jgi:RNA polymerase sigma factor (TIGR02999 family)
MEEPIMARVRIIMTNDTPHDATAILREMADGDRAAADRLMPIVYEELRRMAGRQFRDHQSPSNTLQPTALVHEAFIKMVDQTVVDYESRAHFMAVAAMAMRQILVDSARRRRSEKRGGGLQRVELRDDDAMDAPREIDILELDDALERLAEWNERMSRIVALRFFAGLGIKETADALGIARSTVTEEWRFARAWLTRELGGPSGEG